MNPNIFKAYDIRGIYPDEINEAAAYKIARSFSEYLGGGTSLGKKLSIVISQDMRLSSPNLYKGALKGLLDSGAQVVDIGLSSTPTFYFAVAKGKYDGGLQISASHNPKDYNGLKIVKKSAYPVGLENGLDKIRDKSMGDFTNPIKGGEVIHKDNALSEMIEYSFKHFDFKGIKPFKIVVDAANSMGAPDLEALFDKLPCKLVKMNFKLDGTFPSHQPDPFQEKNIVDLKKKVISEKADLGIATDGDADRIFFIDEKGELIDPSIIRGLLAEFVLKHKKGAKIGYDIRPGKITEDIIKEKGGKPFITKVGHSLIKEESIKKGAEFAGESSGHMFYKTKFGFFEVPSITTLIILKEMSDKKKSISEIIKPLKKYFHSGEINFEVENKNKILNKIAEEYGKNARLDNIDGISIENDDFWFNARTSNTESLVRLNVEARSKEILDKNKKELIGFIISLGGKIADH